MVNTQHPSRPRIMLIRSGLFSDWYTLRFIDTNKPLFVCNVYAPQTNEASMYTTFIKELSDGILKYRLSGPICIGGDFNARMNIFPDTRTNTSGKKLKDMINNLSLRRITPPHNTIHDYTCHTPRAEQHTLSVIDHILVPSEDTHLFSDLHTHNIASSTSDHNAIATFFDNSDSANKSQLKHFPSIPTQTSSTRIA